MTLPGHGYRGVTAFLPPSLDPGTEPSLSAGLALHNMSPSAADAIAGKGEVVAQVPARA